MGITNVERESIPRKTTMLFFIIDTSGSMAGTRIGAVNSAIEQTLEKLREMNADSADAEIEVALLEFSNGARWLTPNGPTKVENYYWSDLDADGLTAMGEAFRMLEEKLHKSSGFMQRASGSYAPVLFLMSDGEPNDDYKTHLAKLQKNGWFKASTKVALAIGDEANDFVLMEFTGSKEAVVRVPDGSNAGEKLAKMVQFIAVTSSQVASNPTDSSDKTKQEQLEEALQSAVNDDDDWDIGDSSGGDDVW
ncbi:MAG: VWA domain-containing protein [Oscillospiraceae bacterium]|nr:VWA domain-containing protein [Oscillospiraceae bacterium]